jgi:hypothetical protein
VIKLTARGFFGQLRARRVSQTEVAANRALIAAKDDEDQLEGYEIIDKDGLGEEDEPGVRF